MRSDFVATLCNYINSAREGGGGGLEVGTNYRGPVPVTNIFIFLGGNTYN